MATTGRDNGMRDSVGGNSGKTGTDKDKDKDKDKEKSSPENSKPSQRDDGVRDAVGTGNGAHGPTGNQAGKDAKGNEIGDKNNPNAGVHTNDMGISVQRTPQAQKNLEKAMDSYRDVTIGETIAGLLGFEDIDPSIDPDFNAATMDAPNTSVDALGIAMGIGGAVLGVPLAGQIPNALKGIGAVPDDFGEITVGIGNEAEETGYGSLPDGTTVDGPVDTGSDPTAGQDAQGGGGDPAGPDGGGQAIPGMSGAITGKPTKPIVKPLDDDLSGGLPTVQPIEGLGIDVLTQQNGYTGDVNIRTPEQRRRRGSLGGLGLGGGIGI